MTTRAPWMPPRPVHGPAIRCTAELLAERSCLVCAHREGAVCGYGDGRVPLPAIETCGAWAEALVRREETES